jgi:hypothetical protein
VTSGSDPRSLPGSRTKDPDSSGIVKLRSVGTGEAPSTPLGAFFRPER